MSSLKIVSLEIHGIFEKFRYNFSDRSLIYSMDNSKGKTTVMRAILYALGFQVPATEGMKDFRLYKFQLDIVKDERSLRLQRKDNLITIAEQQTETAFILPLQEKDLHMTLFGIEDHLVIENILATFYMDQEKGWTLLNRGKIVGNIRFNIDEFVAGLSGVDISSLIYRKKSLDGQLKKYRGIRDIISDDINPNDLHKAKGSYNKDELVGKQMELESIIRYHTREKKQLELVLKENSKFASLLESSGIIIHGHGEDFVLKQEDLLNFQTNNQIIELQVQDHQCAIERAKQELFIVQQEINAKMPLCDTVTLLDALRKEILDLRINLHQVEEIIKQLENQQKSLTNEIKGKLAKNNSQLNQLHTTIKAYSDELGVSRHVDVNDPKFVLTHKLKGLSGRIMSQLAFIFKLAYIKEIKTSFHIALPIIIDSPKSNELSDTSVENMMSILRRDFSDHQIIIASIYKTGMTDFDILDFSDGANNEQFMIAGQPSILPVD